MLAKRRRRSRLGARPISPWRPDDETLESAVTVRHRTNENLRCILLGDRPNQVVASKHLARVEHPNAICAMRTMEYHGSSKRAASFSFADDVIACGIRKTPRSSGPCMRTG